jgi:hypothetical protein
LNRPVVSHFKVGFGSQSTCPQGQFAAHFPDRELAVQSPRMALQTDAFQAAQNLTRAYLALAMFLLALIAFQLITGQSLGIAKSREYQPKAYWTILAAQGAAFVMLIVLLVVHTR